MSGKFSLQPAWRISGVLLSSMFLAGGLSFFVPAVTTMHAVLALGGLMIIIQIAWYLSAYSIANERIGQRSAAASWLFGAHAILGVSGVVAELMIDIAYAVVLLVAAVAVYFVALGIVAYAMVRAEQRTAKIEGAVGTWLLLAYLVVGVWFLRPRLEKLAAPSSNELTPATPA